MCLGSGIVSIFRPKKVSVMVITYNSEKFIQETLESIKNQTYSDYEIVISDDCSTDSTPKILQQFKEENNNIEIKLNFNQKNLGITSNSNKALSMCKGEYISIMGGDDLMRPGKLEKQVSVFQSLKDASIVYHNLRVFESATDQQLYLYNDKFKPRTGDVDNLILYGTFMGACSVMVKNNYPTIMFDEEIPIASDWLFEIESARYGNIYYIDEVLGDYRRHSSNVTSNIHFETSLRERILTLELASKKGISNDKVLNKSMARLLMKLSYNYLVVSDIRFKDVIKESRKLYKLGKLQLLIYILCKSNLLFSFFTVAYKIRRRIKERIK